MSFDDAHQQGEINTATVRTPFRSHESFCSRTSRKSLENTRCVDTRVNKIHAPCVSFTYEHVRGT